MLRTARNLSAHSEICSRFFFFFYYIAPATPGFYTLSLHDALPILRNGKASDDRSAVVSGARISRAAGPHSPKQTRSEEHTSELQSHHDIVCRLLLEKKRSR